MYEVFFIISIASIVEFINRGLGENLISHGTTIILGLREIIFPTVFNKLLR